MEQLSKGSSGLQQFHQVNASSDKNNVVVKIRYACLSMVIQYYRKHILNYRGA